jgi:hypothetical protein
MKGTFWTSIGPLEALAEAWIARVGVPRRRVALGAFALIGVGALLWARHGSTRARVIAAACLLVPLAVGLAARRLEARVWRSPDRIIRRVVGHVDAERAGRALRALTLLREDGTPATPGTSPELARLQVARAVAALPEDRVALAAHSLGQRLGFGALVLGVSAATLFAFNAWRVFEGLDVLVAARGVAPLDVVWLEDLEISARPPDYLHEEERRVRAYGEVALPRGTLLTVTGHLAHPGRLVSMNDGTSEVPFVDDGKGRVVARWPLGESVTLRTTVRFGDVVIREPESTRVTSIADEPPTVVLEGAPRKVMLAMARDDGSIPIRYEAQDDHGLREIHLVLRSGVREERRVLARLDGETRLDRGGHVLRARDPFIKKSHAPVEVTVEAKDNDPVTGPKWGASAAIVVVPPDVGEPAAERLRALRKLRDLIVDHLASRLSHGVPAPLSERAAFLKEEIEGEAEGQELLEATLTRAYAGVVVPGRLQAMLRGQARKVHDAASREAKNPGATTHAALVGATEQFVLVIDAIVSGLGQSDTRAACGDLADVADDLALGASQMQRAPDRARGKLRMEASTQVLSGGARSLRELGVLGRDIGEIVDNDLSRVARAKEADDLVHAEIAAEDLAARLREPDPSFGARGRSGGRAGGESGGGRGTLGDEPSSGDDAEQAFNEAARDLDRLTAEHATELGKVEQDLRQGTDEADLRALAAEGKKHAEAVRGAVSGLPTTSEVGDAWTSKGSAARENAEAMARALERGNPADAASSGRTSLDAMEEAKRTAERDRGSGLLGSMSGDADHAGKRLGEARQRLEPEVKWAEEQISRLRKKAAERKAGELSEDADEEKKLAERAGDLGREGHDREGLPGGAIAPLEEAARIGQEAAAALKRGDVDRALERQHEVQHQLEMAREALGSDQAEESWGEGNGDNNSLERVDIPMADADKGKDAEQFRRRVLRGLSESAGGRQKDAVRRYAEGLLR